jgi:hypothetical protein
MNRRVMRALLALYPRAFRDRYGAELASVTDQLIKGGEITQLRATLSLVCGATLEWWRLLFCSRRTVQAMAAAAIITVAGSLYITGQAPPQSTAASPGTASSGGFDRNPGCRLPALKEPFGRMLALPAVMQPQTHVQPRTFTIKVWALPLRGTHARPSLVLHCMASPAPFVIIQHQLSGVSKS